MSGELLARARAGDREAFAALVEPHRRELQVHCYRMLGSLQDAEDALQDTLVSAWQGLGSFEGRAVFSKNAVVDDLKLDRSTAGRRSSSTLDRLCGCRINR